MDDIERIKRKLNIIDIINPYSPLKKAGKNYKGLCPFHKEKTPSFSVSEEMQRYKCFGCNRSGDIFNFIQEIERVDFSEALELLASKAGITLQKTKPKDISAKKEKQYLHRLNMLALKYYRQVLYKTKQAEKARQYLIKRKLTTDSVKRFKLGYAPDSWESFAKFARSKKSLVTDDAEKQKNFNDLLIKSGLCAPKKSGQDVYDIFRGRLMIPIADPFNKIVGFSGRTLDKNIKPKYVNTPETPVYHKQELLYGLNTTKNYIRQEGFAILVEGYFDLITPYQKGIKNIVATSGTALTEKQISLLKKYTNTVVLLYDSDTAGLEAAIRGIDIMIAKDMNIKVAMLPSPYKDPDDAAVSNIELLKESIKNAVPLWDFYFVYINKKYNLDDIFDKKEAFRFIKVNLVKIKNPIIKTEYQQKAANFFGVSYDFFKPSGANKDNIPNEFHSNQHTAADRGNNIGLDTAYGKLTDKGRGYSRNFKMYVLALTFNIGYDKIKDQILDINSDYFEDSDLETIYNEYIAYSNSNNFDQESENEGKSHGFYNKFSQKHPELAHILEDIYLYNFAEGLLEEKNKLISEVLKSFRRLKKQFLVNKRNKLIEEIKKAEVISDTKKVEDLSKQIASLQEEINPLQE